MSDRDKLIMALEDAITELKVRRERPSTTPEERAEIDAQIIELEGRLAQARAEGIAAAGLATALQSPDAHLVNDMREIARRLDEAVAMKKKTSALLALLDTGLTVLRT